MEHLNQAFEIPADTEAALREEARRRVAGTIDRDALLQKFIEEEEAKQLEEIRSEAADLSMSEEGVGSATWQGFPKKYYEIVVTEGRDPHDISHVKVGVNGYVFVIQRGVKALVPSVVVDTLSHAIENVTTQFEGGLKTKPVPRFPYQVIREVSEDEYVAFAEKCKRDHSGAMRVEA